MKMRKRMRMKRVEVTVRKRWRGIRQQIMYTLTRSVRPKEADNDAYNQGTPYGVHPEQGQATP